MNPAPMRSGSPPVAPALVLVRDDRLRAEVRRVAAAAERVTDERVMPVGRHAWAGAGMVILDTAAAVSAAAAGCPRRAGVVLVTEGEPAVPDWQAATAVGAERVVALPSGAVALVEQFAEHAESRTGEGIVVTVVGAGGGAGASTLAAATALRGAARRVRRDTVLIDGAPLDGGIDLVLGMENVPGLRWPDLIIEDGRVSAAALHNALPAASAGLAVLSCGRARPDASGQGRSPTVSAAEHPRLGCSSTELSPAAVRAVIESGRDAGDLVVCDVSSERGPAADAMLDAADLVVLIVPARLRSIAAAEVVSAYLGERNPNRGLIVRGPAPGGLRGAEVAELLGLPLLAAVRGQAGLASRLERGGLSVRRRGPLRDAADAVLAVVGAEAS
ncbi:septum site-determining protein Ssd [Nocardia sp. XZ_19_231]|uniref:septum site-determining protein Ssd n=1 Tax=Nocardia sp. XZ_19_231 TaxID=2769252 RepID=UPI001E2CD288|nr:septum site-determining protein Ssd [Nocardia sp. XZ_19_231]